MRTIKIYSTTNGLNQLESGATTWGELKEEMNLRGIAYQGMKATESSKNNTLELDEAGLPEGAFVLMLSPQKTKSGNMSYNELRAAIKALVDGSDEAKAHFNHSGKNYTNKSRAELEHLYTTWGGATIVPTLIPKDIIEHNEEVKVQAELFQDTPRIVQMSDNQIIAKAIDAIMQTDEYKDNPLPFNLAFKLLTGETTLEDLECDCDDNESIPMVQEKVTPKLSDEEEMWVRKMQHKV